MSTPRNRQPSGTPTGGQFAEGSKSASGLVLDTGFTVDHPRDDRLVTRDVVIGGDAVTVDHVSFTLDDHDEGWLRCASTEKEMADVFGDDRITRDRARRFLAPRIGAVADFTRRWVGGDAHLDVPNAMQGRLAVDTDRYLGTSAPTNQQLADEADDMAAAAADLHEKMTAPHGGGRSEFAADLIVHLDTRVGAPSVNGTSQTERAFVNDHLATGADFDDPVSDGAALMLLEKAAESDEVAADRATIPTDQASSHRNNGLTALTRSARDADRVRTAAEIDAYGRAQPAAAKVLRSWLASSPTASDDLESIARGDA